MTRLRAAFCWLRMIQPCQGTFWQSDNQATQRMQRALIFACFSTRLQVSYPSVLFECPHGGHKER
jgi:hypothetical protein